MTYKIELELTDDEVFALATDCQINQRGVKIGAVDITCIYAAILHQLREQIPEPVDARL